jgi:hypothetical protein
MFMLIIPATQKTEAEGSHIGGQPQDELARPYPKNKIRRRWLIFQEAEIRRSQIQNQPGQIVHETLAQKKPFTKKG